MDRCEDLEDFQMSEECNRQNLTCNRHMLVKSGASLRVGIKLELADRSVALLVLCDALPVYMLQCFALAGSSKRNCASDFML